MLRIPKNENKLCKTDRDRNDEAKDQRSPKSVPTMGSERTTTPKVAGKIKRAVILTDELKTDFKRDFSLVGFIFENAGKRTVEMGTAKKVTNIAKLVAIR